jgi:hypothetical protein
MIEFATAIDVANLLARVRTHVDQYSDLVLCSPFISDDVLLTLRGLAHSAPVNGCGMQIITAAHTFDRVMACAGAQGWRRTRVVGRPHLHAKFYLAVGRRNELTEAIVTSANLTTAGLSSNIELGVRITPTTSPGRALLHQINRFARRLTINRSVQWKKH